MTIELPEPLQHWLPVSKEKELGGECLLQLVPARPGPENQSLLNRLRSFSPATLGPGVVSPVDGIALQAGLYQWHDFLDESHELSQSIEGKGRHKLGDYWHGIMHRREPDFANAKYWFRHVGRHPIFEPLAERAADVLEASLAPEAARWRRRLISASGWDPFAFVDLCEQCAADEEAGLAIAARTIQQCEFELLIAMTFRQCFGIAN